MPKIGTFSRNFRIKFDLQGNFCTFTHILTGDFLFIGLMVKIKESKKILRKIRFGSENKTKRLAS